MPRQGHASNRGAPAAIEVKALFQAAVLDRNGMNPAFLRTTIYIMLEQTTPTLGAEVGPEYDVELGSALFPEPETEDRK